MGSPPARSILSSITFTKSVTEIQAAIDAKLVRIRAKIKEREGRIINLRDTYGITDQDMIQLLSQAAQDAISNSRIMSTTYSVNSGKDGETKIIGAGVVQNLTTEQALIEQEKDQIERLEMIRRNIRPIPHFSSMSGTPWTQESFDLSYSDLEFLGF